MGPASNGAIQIFIPPMRYLLSSSMKTPLNIPPQIQYFLIQENNGIVAMLFVVSSQFILYYVILASHINFVW